MENTLDKQCILLAICRSLQEGKIVFQRLSASRLKQHPHDSVSSPDTLL